MSLQEAITRCNELAKGFKVNSLPAQEKDTNDIAAFISQQQDTIERLKAKDKDAHLLWLSLLGGGDRKRCMDILELTTGEQDG